MTPAYKDILSAMTSAVRAAMHYIGAEFHARTEGDISDNMGVSVKTDKASLPNFVTKLDIAAEKIICTALSASFPDIPCVGEETGGDLSARRFFLVDPVDGTKNLMALRDNFAVCAAFVEDNDVKVAALADPVRANMVFAIKDAGAWMENAGGRITPLKASGAAPDLKHIQLDAELAFTCAADFEMLARVMPRVSTLRKSGSIAFDFMRLAQNRPEAVVGTGLEPHDIAAGLLVLREAGMKVTDFDGNEADIKTSSVFAAHPKVHSRLIKDIKTARADS